jgi:hypothetical protein
MKKKRRRKFYLSSGTNTRISNIRETIPLRFECLQQHFYLAAILMGSVYSSLGSGMKVSRIQNPDKILPKSSTLISGKLKDNCTRPRKPPV